MYKSVDYTNLIKLIRSKYKKYDDFCKDINMKRTSLSLSLNGKRGFRQPEIMRIADALEINYIDIPIYFFEIKV